jgi:hypothetical protein
LILRLGLTVKIHSDGSQQSDRNQRKRRTFHGGVLLVLIRFSEIPLGVRRGATSKVWASFRSKAKNSDVTGKPEVNGCEQAFAFKLTGWGSAELVRICEQTALCGSKATYYVLAYPESL